MSAHRTRRIGGVLDEDVLELLERVGLAKSFQSGELRCAICGDPIDSENFQGIFVKDGKAKAICSKAACYVAALDLTNPD